MTDWALIFTGLLFDIEIVILEVWALDNTVYRKGPMASKVTSISVNASGHYIESPSPNGALFNSYIANSPWTFYIVNMKKTIIYFFYFEVLFLK